MSSSAHSDEIGAQVAGIGPDGLLSLRPLGGVQSRLLEGRAVWVNGRPGVIGARSGHLTPPEEQGRGARIEDLYVDLGVDDAAAVAALGIRVGDPVVALLELRDLAGTRVAGKAIDNRASCVVLLHVLRRLRDRALPCKLTALVAVQEEVGLRGANVAYTRLAPDLAIVVDTTPATDTPENRRMPNTSRIGQGVVVHLATLSNNARGYLVPHAIRDAVVAAAERAHVPYQLRVSAGGVSDARRRTWLLAASQPSIWRFRGAIRTRRWSCSICATSPPPSRWWRSWSPTHRRLPSSHFCRSSEIHLPLVSSPLAAAVARLCAARVGSGQAVAAQALLDDRDGGGQRDAVADRDEERIRVALGAQHLADLLVVVHERRHGAWIRPRRLVAADEARLGDADAGQIQVETQVRGEAQAARMREPVAVAHQQVGAHTQLRKRIQRGRRLAKGEQPRHIRERTRALGHGFVQPLQCWEREDHDRRARKILIRGVDAGDAVNLVQLDGRPFADAPA